MVRHPLSTPYLAGMIDADGCVRVSSGTGTQYVSITNRFLPALLDVQEMFGGNVRIDRNVYRYEAYGANAREILRQILPHLREKYEQAMLALKYTEYPARSAQREIIRTRVASLKKTCYVSRGSL